MGRQVKFTKDELVAALKNEDGDLTRTAVALGVALSTIYRAMDRHGIQVETERRITTAA
jgi:transcriptional regulator of acetoin/glycerol metabolism